MLPPHPRTWGAGRLFDRMKARLTVERRLAGPEVRQWLDRVAAAPR